MEKLLSIGEVCRIKGISAKSLRYYEKIGILIPAFVNPETGYRYYSIDQLLTIELILICLEFGIPLRQFHTYINDHQSIDIQKLLNDGTEIINKKIRKLQKTQQFLSCLSEHVTRTNQIKERAEIFTEFIPDRYFLTHACPENISDYRAVHASYSCLIHQALKLGIPDSFNQGFFYTSSQKHLTRKIFLEIPKPEIPIENLYLIPGGHFSCQILPFHEFFSSKKAVPHLIVKELFDLKLSPHERLIELQRPLS